MTRRAALAGLAAASLLPMGAARAAAHPPSDHYDGKHFFNPGVAERGKSLGDLWRWMRERQPTPWPDWIDNQPWPKPGPVAETALSVSFIGHACFLIGIGGRWFITDPVYADRASPVPFAGPKRVRAPGLSFDDLPALDGILVSHNHYDHLDRASLRELNRRFQAPVVTSLGNSTLIRASGPQQVTELDWWQSHPVAGVAITYVPAQHFSARGLFDRNATLWGGFVLQAAGRTLYFCGDSGYCPHFREIGQRFPGIDLSLLPIGAYEPRWFMRTQHVNPEEAVQAHLDLGSRRSIGMHFGTFAGLTDEGIDDPVIALAAARQAKGLGEQDFGVLAVGQTLVL